MIMSLEMLALMIEGERIDELEQIEKIYISYAGVMNLQSSLWQMGDWLVHSTNLSFFLKLENRTLKVLIFDEDINEKVFMIAQIDQFLITQIVQK